MEEASPSVPAISDDQRLLHVLHEQTKSFQNAIHSLQDDTEAKIATVVAQSVVAAIEQAQQPLIVAINALASELARVLSRPLRIVVAPAPLQRVVERGPDGLITSIREQPLENPE
jgi:hypothetical protein